MKYANKKTVRLNSTLSGAGHRWALVYRLLLGLLCFIAAAASIDAQQKQKEKIDRSDVQQKQKQKEKIDRSDVQPVKRRLWQIENISAGTVTASDGHGQTIKFNRPSSASQHLNVGQRLWGDDHLVMALDFPVQGSIKNKVGDKDFMETSITFSNTGRIDATTITETSSDYDGFTGGVMVFLFDMDGNVLHSRPLKKYGVNGKVLPSAQWKRKDLWNDTVPVEVVNRTRSVKIVHLKAPTNRTDDFLENAKKVADLAKTFSEIYKDVAGGN